MPTIPYHPYEEDADEEKKRASNLYVRPFILFSKRLQNKLGNKNPNLKTCSLLIFILVFCIFWFNERMTTTSSSSLLQARSLN